MVGETLIGLTANQNQRGRIRSRTAQLGRKLCPGDFAILGHRNRIVCYPPDGNPLTIGQLHDRLVSLGALLERGHDLDGRRKR